MSKKGFTLIELLAIIVILAVIAVITVPLILNIVNDAKKNASIDSAYGYKSALEKYYMKKVVEDTDNILPSGYKEISELPEDFIVSGDSPSEGWVKLNKGIIEDYSLKYDDYVVTKFKDKNIKVSKRSTVANTTQIPDEYKEIEYIQSTGTQYIDVPYTVSNNSIITCDAQFTELDAGVIAYFGGNDTSKWFYAGYSKTDNNYITSRGCTYSQTQSWDTRTISTFNSDERYAASNIYLFARQYQTSISKSKTKIYGCKFYEDDTLIKNLVPVVRAIDEKPGMLDLNTRTNNLFDKSKLKNNMHLNTLSTDNPGYPGYHSTRIAIETPIDVSEYNNVTLSYDKNIGSSISFMYSIFKDGVLLSRTTAKTSGQTIDVSEADELYLAWYAASADVSITTDNVTDIMLNEGTTALPYEPYGYKFYTNAGSGDDFITGPEI